MTAHVWHGYVPGPAARAALRLPRRTARTSPSEGCASTPRKLLIDPYAKALAGEVDWRGAAVRLPARRPDARTSRSTSATTPGACRKGVVVDPRFDWGDDRPPRRALAPTRHLRGARQGLHRTATRRCRRSTARHLRRPGLASRRSTTSRRSASPRSSCCRCTSSSTTSACVDTGLCQLLGLQHASTTSRPTRATPPGRPRRPGDRVQGDGEGAARAGIEVILDVVYNHTAEGNHLGPTLSLPGHRQPDLLPARARGPALLHGLHRHRQQPERAPPAGAAADHGQPALLGAPRCTSTASASTSPPTLARELHDVDRLVRLLRHHPPGPGASRR